MGFDPVGSTFVDTCCFGGGVNLRGSGGPGLGNPDSSGSLLCPDPPGLPVLVWLVLGWLGLLVPVVVVLALAVLVAMALVVLEMASLIYVSGTKFANCPMCRGTEGGSALPAKTSATRLAVFIL
jgi:hypothetical protein